MRLMKLQPRIPIQLSKSKTMQSRNSNLQRESNLEITDTNLTTVREFVLLGFSDCPEWHWLLFGIFSLIYLMILLGNGAVILVARLEPSLHTPMYFFISNFSSVELCFVSVTLPRVLVDLWTQNGAISFLACATQMGFFLVLGAAECFLLAVMAYDRYVAICRPLQYPLIMNRKVCVQLAVGSWMAGFPFQIGQAVQVFTLPFCRSNLINHFFCDIPPVLKLACGDIFVNELVVYVLAFMIVVMPFVLIGTSYSRIISTILRLPSNTGRAKAFSTCSSHLIVVILFYGSASISYFYSTASRHENINKLLALFYTILTPVFNPMIYSLRNKDVTAALRKFLSKLFRM